MSAAGWGEGPSARRGHGEERDVLELVQDSGGLVGGIQLPEAWPPQLAL